MTRAATDPLALVLAALAATVTPRLAAQPEAAAAGPHRFVQIDGAAWSGELLSVRDGAAMIRKQPGGDAERVALDQLYAVSLAAVEAPYAPAPTLWLRSGGVLPARWLGPGGDGEARFEPAPGLAPVALAWRHVRAVLLTSPDHELDDAFVDRIADPGADVDTLYAFTPDGPLQRVSLLVRRVEAERLVVEFGGAERTIPRERVYGVVFGDAAGARPDPQPMPRVTLVLRDAVELSGRLLSLDADRARLRLDEGVEVDVARGRLAELRVRSDKLLYLTELTPAVEQTPAFDRTWPVLRGEGPGGGPIQLAGETYRDGLVMLPKTRLTYRLDAAFDVFEATIGIEDRAGDQAHAVFRVIGDGRVLFESEPVTRASGARALRVPLQGCSRIGLEVDFGKAFDLGDYCVFARPRVIKT